MIAVEIPGWRDLELQYCVLDLNGTLALDGRISEEVKERIRLLSGQLELFLLSSDTFGTAKEVARQLGITFQVARDGEDKLRFVRELGAEMVVAVGNGRNDRLMLREAALAVAVLGPEGLAVDALREADIVAPSPEAALDLLLHPARLVATLRG